MRRSKKSTPSKKRHDKLKIKEREIRASKNVVDASVEAVRGIMSKYGFENYRIEPWEDIRLVSKYDTWIIRTDGEVVFLWHGNSRKILVANDRGSYHLQNVFYDIDFAVKSVFEHDVFKEQV